MDATELPVVVIGAGPQGLAAAAHLRERGMGVVVLEKGATPAAAVREWGHVRLFSAWGELVDPAAQRLLEGTGWTAPDGGYPTGDEWADLYLDRLAEELGDDVVRCRHRVIGAARAGRDLLVSADRDSQPFTVHVVDAEGRESRLLARAVIDASGTWGSPNPAGADGLPALGERSAGTLVSHQIPDPAETDAFAGRHTVVIGSGASAFNALATLAVAAERDRDTRITWVVRRPASATTFGGGEADQLPERGALGLRAKALVDADTVQLLPGFRTQEIRRQGDRAVVVAEDGRATAPADHLVVLTGFRPDLSFLSEVRLDLDPVLQAPRLLASEVDPNLHSCGSVRATGAADLAQPESGFFIVGAKSYGRAPTFLALTGYEQIRSVVAWLAGDFEAAARVELVLPDTGVCGGAGLYDAPGQDTGGCCGAPETEPVPAQEAAECCGGPDTAADGGPNSSTAAIMHDILLKENSGACC